MTSYSRRWNKKRLARVCRSHGQQRMPHLARAQLLLRGIDSTLHCPAQSKYVAVAHALMLPWCLIPQSAAGNSGCSALAGRLLLSGWRRSVGSVRMLRGHLKSSALPIGAATPSPVLSTWAATEESTTAARSLPPSSRSEPTCTPVRGTTGPAAGRLDPLCLPLAVPPSAGTGSATGIF